MASNMNRGYPVPPQPVIQGNAVPPAGPTPVPVPPPVQQPPGPSQPLPPPTMIQTSGPPMPSNAMGPVPPNVMGPVPPNVMGPVPSNVMGPVSSNVMGPVSSNVMGPVPPNVMGPVPSNAMGNVPSNAMGPVPPPGPGMRPPDRPMPLQYAGPPPSRQHGASAPVYQPQPQRAGYPSGPMQGSPAPPPQTMHRVGQGMGPPTNTYSAGRVAQSPVGSMNMETSRKRPAPDRSDGRSQGPPPSKSGAQSGGGSSNAPNQNTGGGASSSSKKKKKLAEKILPQKVCDLVPESQAYMDLLAFERKLDFTIMRKRLDIQEALKRPMKQKRKLRIFISNTFYPGKPEGEAGEEPTVPSWELRVEGRLLDDPGAPKADQSKVKRKFSSFFKSLVIELDKDLYGPDNHLVEWHRTPTTTETDGFQVKRPGDKNVRCTILLLLDYQPLQFKLDPRLARLLGIHTQTRPIIISALWQYIKTHKLQDAHEREYINCDKYLEQIFQCSRMKFAEIPQRLHQLLHPADPIVINHIISVEGPDTKKTACYDIDVEVDDPLKSQMNNFLLSTASQQEIQTLDNKIHETVETINQLKTNREFFLSFAKEPQQFINKWLISQTRDLKTMTDVVGNPEEERRSDYYYQPWAQEAVCRYFYGKVNQRRAELEQALGIRNT